MQNNVNVRLASLILVAFHFCLWNITESILYSWLIYTKNEYDMVIRENWVSLYVFATVCNRSWKSVPWDHEPMMAYEECSQSLTCECFIVTSILGVSIYLTMVGHMHRRCQMLLELQVKCCLSHTIGLQSWQTRKAFIHTAEKASTLLHVATFLRSHSKGEIDANYCARVQALWVSVDIVFHFQVVRLPQVLISYQCMKKVRRGS
jgi:hypothetical protein